MISIISFTSKKTMEKGKKEQKANNAQQTTARTNTDLATRNPLQTGGGLGYFGRVGSLLDFYTDFHYI